MRRHRSSSVLGCVVPALLLTACDGVSPIGPLGPLPGGRLEGTLVREAVTDWSFTDAEETFAVETRPNRPYSVTTWGFHSDGNFYVPTRDPHEKAWVQNVLADSRVRLKVGDRLFEMKAVRVMDTAEFERVIPKLLEKYDLDRPDPADEGEVWLLRLSPR